MADIKGVLFFPTLTKCMQACFRNELKSIQQNGSAEYETYFSLKQLEWGSIFLKGEVMEGRTLGHILAWLLSFLVRSWFKISLVA